MIVADKVRYITTDTGDIEVIFTVSGFNNKRIAQRLVSELKGKTVELKAKEHRSQRSIDQNRLMWQIISDICVAESGNRHQQDMWRIYSSLLVMSNIKYTEIRTLVAAKDILEKNFRAIVEVPNSDKESKKGLTRLYWVFYGSSTFNKKEMSDLISNALDWASKLGIDTSLY